MISMPLSRRVSASAKFALLALGVLVLSPAIAKQNDREQPMDVKASHFDGFQKPNSITTLTGNVVITQGTLKATSAEARVYYDGDSQISRIVLTGKPARLEQLDDNNNLMQGESTTVDYQLDKDLAILSGNASIHQKGRGEAHGDTLSYNTKTSAMTGDSHGDGSVHLIFQPKPKGK